MRKQVIDSEKILVKDTPDRELLSKTYNELLKPNNKKTKGFPSGAVVKNPPANAGDARDKGSIPGWGRSPRVGNGKPLHYSCLKNSMDRGTWWGTVHGLAKN